MKATFMGKGIADDIFISIEANVNGNMLGIDNILDSRYIHDVLVFRQGKAGYVDNVVISDKGLEGGMAFQGHDNDDDYITLYVLNNDKASIIDSIDGDEGLYVDVSVSKDIIKGYNGISNDKDLNEGVEKGYKDNIVRYKGMNFNIICVHDFLGNEKIL